jgi:hypothetical protein
MGKREDKKLDADSRPRKREKKKKEGGPRRWIVDVLACPPAAKFHYELVVGNGIGDDAVEDAQEAFKRAWEARRQKAHEAASQPPNNGAKDLEVAEHRVIGPFSSAQDWRIDSDIEPMTAMTWCWVGYESITFFKPS